jgi:hypothetical protein
MIGHELRQVSLYSAAQAVLPTLSTGATRRASPGPLVQKGCLAPRRRHARTPRRCGRLPVATGSSAGDGQVARRRRGPQFGLGVTGRANQAAGGAAAPLGGASLHCQRGDSEHRRSLRLPASVGGLERRPGRFFGRPPVKGPAGPMAARLLRPLWHESGPPTCQCQRRIKRQPPATRSRPGAGQRPREPELTWGCGL